MLLREFFCLVGFAAFSTTVESFSPRVQVKRSLNFASKFSLLSKPTVEADTAANDENEKYCLPLEKVGLSDLARVGGKTASLGEMIQNLTPLGVDVPGGFAVTANAYDAVLDRFRLRERLALLMDGIDGKFIFYAQVHLD